MNRLPHRTPLRRAEAGGPRRAGHLRHRRRSRSRDLAGAACGPCRRPAPMSSSSACPSPIRWPTGRRSRPPRCARSPPGMTMKKTLALVRDFRRERCGDADRADGLLQSDLSLRRGERFLADAKAAGVDGLIVVDLPPEEDDELCLPAQGGGLAFHPPGDADDRRQAPAGRAAQHRGLRLLRLDRRHHRHPLGRRCRYLAGR